MKVSKKDKSRVWGEGALRVFISHTSSNKADANQLKVHLDKLGISSFVAHENIDPTRPWQEEIKLALFSMDVFVALLTKDFKKSNWTDQETGVAVGLEKFIISIRIDRDPYGFIGDYQAITAMLQPHEWANKIWELILENETLNERAIDAYILALERAESYGEADYLLEECLPKISTLTDTQRANLVGAFNGNSQVSDSLTYKSTRSHVKNSLNSLTDGYFDFGKQGKLSWSVF